MPDLAISVEGLSKRYRIGVEEEKADTLTKALARMVTSPVRNLRRLRSLSTFGRGDGQAEDLIWALHDVSFEVEQGEIVGIIGPNGAGKSTLLKILSRITPPTDGRVVLNGRVSSLLEVGTGFHQELTGRENVYLNGTVLGMSRKEVSRKFDDIVDFAGVEKFMDTPVKRYSSGMKMRLAFSVAAHLEPEILLIDEVLAVGDAEFQKKCLGRMEEVAGEGRTVLFVSHNMSAVNRLCPRTILLDGGHVRLDDETVKVTSAYFQTTGGSTGQLSWPDESAPGTDELRLKSVTLHNTADPSVSVTDVRQPLRLKLSYTVQRPNLRFRCTAAFFTQGVCAFTSIEPEERTRKTPGDYCSTLLVPPNLFAEGEYTISLSIISTMGAKIHFVELRDALTFRVVDSMSGMSARGDYTRALGGVLRPLLTWESELENVTVETPV